MAEKKKVLIVTYYWPPAGGPGVQRVLKFVKYMRLYNWEPVVLTVANGEYSAIDPQLENEIPPDIKVYKTKTIEPFKIYKTWTGKKKDERISYDDFAKSSNSFTKRISKWIRLNLFIPDPRIGWYFYAAKQVKEILAEHKIDLIYSTSPPHSVQVSARRIAKKYNLKWVADFRDPWSELVHYQNNPRSKLTRLLDNHLEKLVFKRADRIITVSQEYKSDIRNHTDKKISVIYNGFDPEDIPEKETSGDSFTITYTGELSYDRIPHGLLKALKRLKKYDIKLQFVGNTCPELKNLVKEYKLENEVIYKSYMPHKDSLMELAKSDLLLVIINNTEKGQRFVPGKLFEYMGMKIPVLLLGPKTGEAATILAQCKAGISIATEDSEAIYLQLIQMLEGNFPELDFTIDAYNRKFQTGELCSIFDTLLIEGQ